MCTLNKAVAPEVVKHVLSESTFNVFQPSQRELFDQFQTKVHLWRCVCVSRYG